MTNPSALYPEPRRDSYQYDALTRWLEEACRR